jgi:hypothetical protein
MAKYVLHLRFQPDIIEEEWGGICAAIKTTYPTVIWPSFADINQEFELYMVTLAIEKYDKGDYILAKSDNPLGEGEYGLPEPLDGRQWVKDRTVDTEDIFKQLYESKDSYRPKINLKFNPPIEDAGELDKILETIHNTQPSVKWYGDNDILTYNPISEESHDDEEIQVHFLTIGYFPNKPNSLTYSSYADDNEWVGTSIDGWEWLESKKINVDDVFNKLYESENRVIDLTGLEFIWKTNFNGEDFNISYTVTKQEDYVCTVQPNPEPALVEYLQEYLGGANYGGRDVNKIMTRPKKMDLYEILSKADSGVYKFTNLPDTEPFIDKLYESEIDKSLENFKPPAGSYLYCHTDGYMVDEDGEPTGKPFATEGKEYKITGYTKRNGDRNGCKEALTILDNMRTTHLFGVTGCYDGPAYLKWFYPSVKSLPSHEDIWKTMNEQEDDLEWVKDITQNLDYWRLLQVGQKVRIKPHQDPKQQEYFKATLMKCRKASTPSFYYGKTIKVRDIHVFERRDIDCFTCDNFYLDCREQVKAIEASGFWVSSDMVDIEIVS